MSAFKPGCNPRLYIWKGLQFMASDFLVRGQAVGKAAGGYLLPFEIVRV